MNFPKPDVVADWYGVLSEVLEGFFAPQLRSRKRRYAELKYLNNLISDIYVDYTKMFTAFEANLPGDDSSDDWGEEDAKNTLKTARENQNATRILTRNTIAGLIRASEDRLESRFLFSAYLFLDFREDFARYTDIVEDFDKQLETFSSAGTDSYSPSGSLVDQAYQTSSPQALRVLCRDMQVYTNRAFQFVVESFRQLEDAWNLPTHLPLEHRSDKG